jgi:ferredoxin-type protein NapH
MARKTERSALARRRSLTLALGIVLMLPPLAVLMQLTTGDAGFCGPWCPRMFFVWRAGTSGEQFLFGMLRAWAGVGLVVALLVVTVLFGRLWCSHLCPIGGAMELGSRLVPKRFKIDFSRVPAAPVRYGYLAVYMLAPALGIGSLCCSYCNFATVPRLFGAVLLNPADIAYFLRAAGLVNLALIILLGFAARGGRAYCNFLCPIGAIDSLVNRVTMRFGRRLQIVDSLCTQCGACHTVCPVWAIPSRDEPQIDQLSCMPCGACQQVCTPGAIRYAKPVLDAQAQDEPPGEPVAERG